MSNQTNGQPIDQTIEPSPQEFKDLAMDYMNLHSDIIEGITTPTHTPVFETAMMALAYAQTILLAEILERLEAKERSG